MNDLLYTLLILACVAVARALVQVCSHILRRDE